MQRLAPLAVGFLVAMTAILWRWKRTGLNKLVSLDGCVAGKRYVVFAEAEVIRLPDFVGVIDAVEPVVRLDMGDEPLGSQEAGKASEKRARGNESSTRSRFHRGLPG